MTSSSVTRAVQSAPPAFAGWVPRVLLMEPPTEPPTVKLSYPLDPVGPSLMNHNRALQNPPLAVTHSGLPSHQNHLIETDYLVVCEAHSTSLTDGRWRFTIEAADGQIILDAEDQEFGDLNRLTLLAAVRGLESLDGPSAVTLLSNNRYLIRSLSKSLPRWRQNNFVWEHFGRRIEVQHADLWRRIDRALSIHRVQACLISSCLVSQGLSEAETGDRRQPEFRQSGATSRVDAAHGSVVPAPSHRLRRLINGSRERVTADASSRRRGRFTAADLNTD